MQIFSKYLDRFGNPKPIIDNEPVPGLFNIIVIPAIGEPDLLITLDSLRSCKKPHLPVEIIVVLNASESSQPCTIEQNLKSKNEIDAWMGKNNLEDFRVFCILMHGIPKKIAGAGNARKIGMDEAIHRFLQAGNPGGIISSLDADACVDSNYLTEIEQLFFTNPSLDGCSIYFEHDLSGPFFSEKIYQTIIDYELHLRYYKQALRFIGFPYFHHTVGSSFAVKASTYCRQGGMNRKQAGEDFYFLHKIMPLGKFIELNTTCVRPSSRPSERVPFGTGATIRQYAVEKDQTYLTYDIESFLPLKKFFDDKDSLFKIEFQKLQFFFDSLDDVLKEFLNANDFFEAIHEINANSSNLSSFRKRFFYWFDAFRLIKYLNYAHSAVFSKKQVNLAAFELLVIAGHDYDDENSPIQLLKRYRAFEKDHPLTFTRYSDI